ADSISSFQRQLSVLERRAGTASPAPYRAATPSIQPSARLTRSEARKRRRDVLYTLAGAAILTFPLAVILGGPVWGLHLLCDLLLGAYVVLLIQTQQRMGERDTKV